MALTTVGFAWAVVTLWFGAWAAVRWRIAGAGAPFDARFAREALLPAGVEALLLTLIAALWFGSLGHGGWPLLFLLLALLADLPPRLRITPRPPVPWVEAAGAVLRLLVAGGLLAWRL